MVTRIIMVVSLTLLALAGGCGEQSPLEHVDSFPQVPSDSLTALQFPTANGSWWKYELIGGSHSYTSEISGTQNLGGFTVRILKSDSVVSVDQVASLYDLPLSSSFFIKNLDSYTEYAYEVWLPVTDQTLTLKNVPERILWAFPLYTGKEWSAGKTQTFPRILYNRKVISSGNTEGVTAGTFNNVYYVEEYASIPELPDFELPPNKYWLAPHIGVIKYSYTDLSSGFTRTYQLTEFAKGQ